MPERCVCCGAVIPEGRQVCPKCERKTPMDMKEKLIRLIQDAVSGCARHWAEVIADYLLANGTEVRKHGRWVPYDMFGARQWACSECQTLGSPLWKACPVCDTKMDLPAITDQAQAAIEKMGRKAHGEE